MQQRHVVRLETRPPSIEGQGAVAQRELVINALRMRPDRIMVGEARGPEALDMLQAMNTGHDGSMTTVHANSPRDCFHRIETMVLMANVGLTEQIIRQQVASAIQVIIHTARLHDGARRITSITEVRPAMAPSFISFPRTGRPILFTPTATGAAVFSSG